MSADVHLIHRTYADLLGSLERERDDAIKVAQDSARMAPNLFGAATDMLEDSIDFQRDHVRQLIENATGTREFEVRAFAEREQSVRNRQTLDFLWNASDRLEADVPICKKEVDSEGQAGIGQGP